MNAHLRLAGPRKENHKNIDTRSDRYPKIHSHYQNCLQFILKILIVDFNLRIIYLDTSETNPTQAEALQCCRLEAHSAKIHNTQTKPHLQMIFLLNTSWSLILWQNCKELTQW